jgi:hypothetical protein
MNFLWQGVYRNTLIINYRYRFTYTDIIKINTGTVLSQISVSVADLELF